MATEEPQFTVESKNENFEIRKYGPTLVAETVIDADFDQAGKLAFRILADYIFGNNTTKAKIAMTAPVAQQPQSEKISMMAPVNQIKDHSHFIVQFTMPEPFTLKTIPKPNDARVHLREIPARRIAVFSYSGSWSEERYKTKLQIFKNTLAAQKMKTKGGPIFARFNPPFTLWFLRRNEIWLELAE